MAALCIHHVHVFGTTLAAANVFEFGYILSNSFLKIELRTDIVRFYGV